MLCHGENNREKPEEAVLMRASGAPSCIQQGHRHLLANQFTQFCSDFLLARTTCPLLCFPIIPAAHSKPMAAVVPEGFDVGNPNHSTSLSRSVVSGQAMTQERYIVYLDNFTVHT